MVAKTWRRAWWAMAWSGVEDELRHARLARGRVRAASWRAFSAFCCTCCHKKAHIALPLRVRGSAGVSANVDAVNVKTCASNASNTRTLSACAAVFVGIDANIFADA